MDKLQQFETDVLIIGGGMAALFAAIKAKERGADVVVVDKGYAGKSGQSPYADGFTYVDPITGDMEKAVKKVNKVGEYINNRKWCEICLKESYDRLNDLLAMGVEFFKDEEGNLIKFGPPGEITDASGILAVNIKGIKSISTMRNYAQKLGVRFVDRTMITDLLTNGKKVIGAVGLSTEEAEMKILKAKATILCTGASGFKPSGWPIHELTSDGDAMAYRVGAEITGKEFVDTHFSFSDNPSYMNFKEKYSKPKDRPPIKKITGADGQPIKGIGTLFLEFELEIHKGNGPITAEFHNGEKKNIVGGITNGMSVHKGEGIWAKNTKCETTVEGLYAAGDALGNAQTGAVYAGGLALAGSAVTGARAGKFAAEYVLNAVVEDIAEEQVKEIKERIYEPLNRQGGFSPRWVLQMLQNNMSPYYVTYIKDGKRLEAVLTLIEFIRDHLVPKMKANDAHELRLALEVKNMVLNAEMKLRASLFRTESRGTHYREDFPRRDDENFLAWVTLKNHNGKMVCNKIPIPKEWHPDLSLSVDEKYIYKFSGDLG